MSLTHGVMQSLAGIETFSLQSVRAWMGIASDRAAVKRLSTHRMELTAQVKRRRIGIVNHAVGVMRFLPQVARFLPKAVSIFDGVVKLLIAPVRLTTRGMRP